MCTSAKIQTAVPEYGPSVYVRVGEGGLARFGVGRARHPVVRFIRSTRAPGRRAQFSLSLHGKAGVRSFYINVIANSITDRDCNC